MDNNKVTGKVQYGVFVKCPHCKNELNLNDIPYSEERNRFALGMFLFGSPTITAQWHGINLRYNCSLCKKEFILSDFEC